MGIDTKCENSKNTLTELVTIINALMISKYLTANYLKKIRLVIIINLINILKYSMHVYDLKEVK